MVHDGALQRRHDLLAIVDGQSNVTVKQALPALVDADLLSARIAKFVPALDCDRPFHRHRFVSGQNDGDGLIEPNIPCPTPEKLPVSIMSALQSAVVNHDPGEITGLSANVRIHADLFVPMFTIIARTGIVGIVDPINMRNHELYSASRSDIVFRPFELTIRLRLSVISPAHQPLSYLASLFMDELVAELEQMT